MSDLSRIDLGPLARGNTPSQARPAPASRPAAAGPGRRGEDRVELSNRARSAAPASAADEAERTARIDRIRGEINEGLYDTDERIELTIDLLLDTL